LLSLDATSIEALRAKHDGNVLVLNFWATWCTPCKAEFPDFVKLQKKYGDKGLDVVFVSIDDDDAKNKRSVVSFLRKQNAQLPSYIKSDGDDEQFINAVSSKWSGAIPATFVYDRKGNLVKMRAEETNFAELEQTVRPLLH
jgi:thiol-disulfide isomerase/thioredoxin